MPQSYCIWTVARVVRRVGRSPLWDRWRTWGPKRDVSCRRWLSQVGTSMGVGRHPPSLAGSAPLCSVPLPERTTHHTLSAPLLLPAWAHQYRPAHAPVTAVPLPPEARSLPSPHCFARYECKKHLPNNQLRGSSKIQTWEKVISAWNGSVSSVTLVLSLHRAYWQWSVHWLMVKPFNSSMFREDLLGTGLWPGC